MLGLRCCKGFFSRCGKRGYSPVMVYRLLTVVAFAVVGHGLQGAQASVLQHVVSTVAVPGLSSTESIVVVLGVRGSKACGIFPDQGLNLCLLHWQEDSLPLSYQGSLRIHFQHFTRTLLFFSTEGSSSSEPPRKPLDFFFITTDTYSDLMCVQQKPKICCFSTQNDFLLASIVWSLSLVPLITSINAFIILFFFFFSLFSFSFIFRK